MVLNINENFDPEVEKQQISRFCSLKIEHFRLWMAMKIELKHEEYYFFQWDRNKQTFYRPFADLSLYQFLRNQADKMLKAILPTPCEE